MISSKTLYSKYFSEYKLSQEQLVSLQKVLFEMFLDVKNLCDKYNIDYMLSGGTLLGAIRHGGFIPWDDDIDIMMLRKEYERFSKIFKRELNEKYELVEPLDDDKYVFKAPKIFKKNTTFIEIENAGIHKYDMIFIDVFIIEFMANPGIKRNIISKVYDFSYKGASVCVDYLYLSPIIENKTQSEKEVRNYYKFRRTLGFLFSHIGGINFYLRVVDKLGRRYKNTSWLGIPSGISYNREIFNSEMFTDLIEGEFCGVKVKIPRRFDLYLRNLYGDYMKIPPEEDREMHIVYKMDV